MNLEDLTEAQKARAKECETPEELMALAKAEGVELTDAQLDAVSGGREWYEPVTDCSRRGPGGL